MKTFLIEDFSICLGVNNTGGAPWAAPWAANISTNFRKKSKRPQWYTQGIGGNWFMKKKTLIQTKSFRIHNTATGTSPSEGGVVDRSTSTYPTEMCTIRGSLRARSIIFNVWSQGLKMASRLEVPGSRNTASSEVLQCHSSREGFFRLATPLLPDRVPAKFTMRQTADNHKKLNCIPQNESVSGNIWLCRGLICRCSE